MGKHVKSIDKQFLARIRSHGRGWVFTPGHFDDLGSRSAISTILQRHCDAGVIRRLARGLYDFPRMDDQLGMLFPSTDAIASALAGRDGIRLQPSGAYAANLLGLSSQVPMKVVFLTDGRSRTVRIGNRTIVLKHTTPRNMMTAGKISGLVIQALRSLGKHQVDAEVIATLERRLDDKARRQLMKDIRYAPAWIADIIRTSARGVTE
jgi:hypothetical protein